MRILIPYFPPRTELNVFHHLLSSVLFNARIALHVSYAGSTLELTMLLPDNELTHVVRIASCGGAAAMLLTVAVTYKDDL